MPPRLLLAEDDEELREVMAFVLDRAGFDVVAAVGDGQAALDALAHVGPVHAIVTDVDMPRLSGLDLAARALARWPGVRILLVSGREANARRLCVRHARAIRKPFSASELVGALTSLIEA